MIVDTDVLIWYLRGHEKAAEVLHGVGRFDISVITYMELVQGMRSKTELRVLRSSLERERNRSAAEPLKPPHPRHH
ncbi:MAG: PIN domain-containing protein [Gemmatimonadota bacterium]